MKYVATRELRNNPSSLWEAIDSGVEVVVTVNGKPRAIMIKADEELDMLLKAISRAKAELSVERIRLQSLKSGLDKMSDEEIDKEIEETRKERG